MEWLREAVVGGRIASLVVADDVEAARAELDAADAPVGCALVSDALDDADPSSVIRTLREEDRLLPILFVATTSDPEGAWAATRAGADGYVSAGVEAEDQHSSAVGVPADEVRALVDDRVAAYARRRWEAADSAALEAVLDVVEGSIYVKDAAARHLHKSRVAGDVAPEEARGKTDRDLYSEAGYEEDLEVLETGEPIEGKRGRFETTDGTHHVRTSKRPWRDESGEVAGLVGHTMDVTETVEHEERLAHQEDRLEAVAETYTHDLRTPLSLATGYLEQARATGDDALLEEVEAALDRIDEMLDDLRAVASEQESEVPPTIDESDPLPETALPDVARNVWASLDTGDATLDVDVPESTVVQAASGSIRTVLENLFKNSLKHGGDGVRVRVTLLDHGGFAVEDDGPGIPPEERERVRERGYTTSETGSGVGLALVDEIADRLEWTLTIDEGAAGGARIALENCLTIRDPPGQGREWTAGVIEDAATVGSPAIDGDVSHDDDHWTVTGAGRSIVGDVNEFHFAYTTLEVPARIQARVLDVEDVSEWSFAGVMLRSSLDEDAAYGAVGPSAGRGTTLLWRPERGDPGVDQAIADAADSYAWVRVEVTDELVTASVSRDGAEWRPVDQRLVDLGEQVFAGLAVCSTIPGEDCTATFDSVSAGELDGGGE